MKVFTYKLFMKRCIGCLCNSVYRICKCAKFCFLNYIRNYSSIPTLYNYSGFCNYSITWYKKCALNVLEIFVLYCIKMQSYMFNDTNNKHSWKSNFIILFTFSNVHLCTNYIIECCIVCLYNGVCRICKCVLLFKLHEQFLVYQLCIITFAFVSIVEAGIRNMHWE